MIMKIGIARFFICVGFSLLVGCGSLQESRVSVHSDRSANRLSHSASTATVKKKLLAQYQKWRGVRYRLGGLSRRGVDCSGLVMLVFKSQFGIDLPRTTHNQANSGKYISQSALKSGDLVFFKIGIKSRHVGIYLEHGKFMHASSSKGVTISRLDNVYWRAKYWKSIRV